MNLAADRGRNLRRQAKAMLKLRPPPEALPASVEALALAESASGQRRPHGLGSDGDRLAQRRPR